MAWKPISSRRQIFVPFFPICLLPQKSERYPNQNPRKHSLVSTLRVIEKWNWVCPILPFEILYDILSRLPVKSLCRFKSVSKSWLDLITDPQFVKSHLHRQPTNENNNNINRKIILCSSVSPVSYSVDCEAPDHAVARLEISSKSGIAIYGSLNGVLLLDIGVVFREELCLWNPSIRLYQKFSPPKRPFVYEMIYGLGYDSTSDDFKVVAADFPLNGVGSVVHVFSSKLSSWNRIGNFGYSNYVDGLGIVLNGAPHWFLLGNGDLYFRIVYFDVTEEKFKEVPKPIYEVDDGWFVLGVLGGWLCVVDHRGESQSDVWVMKEYGVKESWTKLFVVPNKLEDFYFDYFDVLCFIEDEEVVIMLHSRKFSKLVVYCVEQKTFKTIGIPWDCKQQLQGALYVESLVSPHGCNDTRRHSYSDGNERKEKASCGESLSRRNPEPNLVIIQQWMIRVWFHFITWT